jgi:two-component system, chemotaxis family, protein-glutamate methylesterase/glutaminase
MKPIRVLIVDDSAFVRKALTSMLQGEADVEVVGLASNGQEAIDRAVELKPDIITLDVEMPVMNGLEALKIISSLTSEGAAATIEAMSLGAVDFIPKQSTLTVQHTMKEELLGKIRALGQNQSLKSRLSRTQQILGALSFRSTKSSQPDAKSPSSDTQNLERLSLQERIAKRRESLKTDSSDTNAMPSLASTKALSEVRLTGRKRPVANTMKVVVLGVSTGGPLALHQVIPRLPADMPVGMLIIQHMPAHFTKSLADRLNSLSHVRVREAQDNDVLEPGLILIAPGGLHMTIGKDHRTIHIATEPSTTLHRPSVDVTVNSVVEGFGGNALGVIMTGMGRDGCAGLKKLHEKGGYVIAQDEESCVVYGMPKAVVDEGIADEVQPLEHLADAIAACVGCQAVNAKSA